MSSGLHTRGYRPKPGERRSHLGEARWLWHWAWSEARMEYSPDGPPAFEDEASAALDTREAPDPLLLRNLDRVSNNEAFRLYAFMHREGLGPEDMVNDARRS